MNLIESQMSDMDILVELAEIEVDLNKLMLERDMGGESSDINTLFDETMAMLNAAKKGLGLANKLTDPAGRKKHKSRVMGNMNRIRAKFNRLQKVIASGDKVESLANKKDES